MTAIGAREGERRRMKLGLMLQQSGHHVAAWLHPDAWPDSGIDFPRYLELARMAEEALFDFVFEADSLSGERFDPESIARTALSTKVDPLTFLTAVAACTREIGVVATATTTYDQPYLVARRFASLDLVSGGRSGWNVVTSAHASEARNFGGANHPAKDARYRRAREFVEVVRGLWDSYDEGAIEQDRERATFVDMGKTHVLDHEGAFFRVRGPLTVPRSPQGHPVIVQAGASDEGRQLAAETSEVVFTAQQTLADARAFYADVKKRAEASGRDPDHVLIMPGFGALVKETQAEAEDAFQSLQNLITPDVGLSLLARYLECDTKGFDIDAPLPVIDRGRDVPSRALLLIDLARREGLTVKRLYQRIASGRGHFQVVGSPKHVADVMEEWFTTGAADGFNIIPPIFPTSLADINRLLIPELQRRGLFRERYEGPSLREKLGLPMPASRYGRAAVTA